MHQRLVKVFTASLFCLLAFPSFANTPIPPSTQEQSLKAQQNCRKNTSQKVASIVKKAREDGTLAKNYRDCQYKKAGALDALCKRVDTITDVNDIRQRLDVWIAKPKKAGAKTPLVVFVHGGGFRAGCKEGVWEKPLYTKLLAAGVSFAAIHYRLVMRNGRTILNSYPTPMDDAKAALDFLIKHASTFNIDPSKICLAGGSAGAGIIQWLAYKHPGLVRCIVPDSAQTSYHPVLIQQAFHAKFTPKVKNYTQVNLPMHSSLLPLAGIWHPNLSMVQLSQKLFLCNHMTKQPKNCTNHIWEAVKKMRQASPILHFEKLTSSQVAPTLFVYGRSNEPVTSSTDPSVWVHHPAMALALQAKCNAKSKKMECLSKVKILRSTDGNVRLDKTFGFLKAHLGF